MFADLYKRIKEGEINPIINVDKAEGIEIPNLREAIISAVKSTSKDRPFDYKYHPSEMGGCARKVFFDHVLGPSGKGAPAWNTKLKFYMGDSVHEIVQHFLGVFYGEDFKKEVPLSDDELGWTGTCDGVLMYKGVKFIVEIKSCNVDSLNHVMAAGPYESNLVQLNCYMHMGETEHGLVFFYCKDNNAMQQFYIRRDSLLVAKLKAQSKYTTKCINEVEVPEKYVHCSDDDLNKKCGQYMACKKFVNNKLVLPMYDEVDKKRSNDLEENERKRLEALEERRQKLIEEAERISRKLQSNNSGE